MENLPASYYDASALVDTFDAEFSKRLATGSLRHDDQIGSEYIAGINANGQTMRVMRPDLDEEKRGAAGEPDTIKYLVEVSPPQHTAETDPYLLVIMNDSSITVIIDGFNQGKLRSSPEADAIFDGIYW